MHCMGRGGCYLVNSLCELQEEDRWGRESYQASWLNLVMETRPQYKLTLSEKDISRRESYEEQQVVHFIVRRSPSQILKLGSHGGIMTEHQLPSKTTCFVPLLNPISAESSLDLRRVSPFLGPPHVQGPVIAQMENNGVCVDKQDVSVIKKDLPKLTKPIRVNFRASSLMSSPRETSHWVHRRQ
ncbi:telethonin [Lampris incognitus]|uniref:telethonin n=1 Tax=Lampris incognitus TaxID=2546036 RepID=UPI0024B60885|nr:telethonin [Lampris incognitus]